MSKRTFDEFSQNERTIDFAPSSKRTKLLVMPSSSNKIGTFDEKAQITRTSNLLKPTMLLEGHSDALYTCKFSDDGIHMASGGRDRDILLWHVYGECENHTTLKGHKGSILQLQWSGGSDLLFSAATDNTGAIWNVEYGLRLKKVKEHASIVNSIYATKRGTQYYATGSDDGTAKIFDLRIRQCIQRFDSTYQVTSVALCNNASKIFSGGIDNCVKVWDTRKNSEPMYTLMKHTDTITSLRLSHDENYLLSNGMDNRLCIWDIRPFVGGNNNNAIISEKTRNALNNAANRTEKENEEEDVDIDVQTNGKKDGLCKDKENMDECKDDEDNNKNKNKNENENTNRSKKPKIYDSETESTNRLYRVFGGAQHGNEKLLIKGNWSNDDKRVCCGSSDKMAYIFDVENGKLLYRLPGHKGSVNEVDYHPKEPIVLSCSSDKTIFLGEL